MKKIISTCIIVSSLATSAFSLEFGTMGNQAFGMAGTGVAVKKSSWGLYYNPALIAADSGFKLGLYAGFHAKSKNFWEILNQDLNNPDPENVKKILQLLQNNHISFTNQDGVVFQIPDFGIGVLAIGGFLNARAQGSANIFPKLNLDQIQIPATQRPKIQTNFSAYALIEAPLGYAYEFETPAGDLSIGLAVKYMNLSSTQGSFTLDDKTNFGNSLSNLLKIDLNQNVSNVGLDVGITYEPVSFITLGLVGKNLNAPSFDFGSQKVKIDPQARAGIALNAGFWSLALDADLTSNEFLGSNIKNQMISMGTALDFKFFSLRGGVATDLQNKDDLIFAVGLGLAFFDIGVQFGTKTSPLDGMKIPNYLAFQIGAGFSF